MPLTAEAVRDMLLAQSGTHDKTKSPTVHNSAPVAYLPAEARHPTRTDLDRVSTQHPVWVVHVSGHLAAANSKALDIAGVTKATAQPRGGRIRIDSLTGAPDGGGLNLKNENENGCSRIFHH